MNSVSRALVANYRKYQWKGRQHELRTFDRVATAHWKCYLWQSSDQQNIFHCRGQWIMLRSVFIFSWNFEVSAVVLRETQVTSETTDIFCKSSTNFSTFQNPIIIFSRKNIELWLLTGSHLVMRFQVLKRNFNFFFKLQFCLWNSSWKCQVSNKTSSLGGPVHWSWQ